ncbi:MAG: hypothetical protein PHX78_09855 [bacterium]|nr:hypothetical protein [bacterium]
MEIITLKYAIRYLMVCFFLLVLVFDVKVKAALVIKPAYIMQKLTQKRISDVFYIKNVGDKEERYRATAIHFIVGDKGGLQVIPSDEYSLAQWIKFNPTEFILPPNTSRMIRYSIIPQGKLKEREYWGAIQFVPLKGQTVTTKGKEGQDISLEVVSVILVPIYGKVEGTKFSGELSGFEAKQQKDDINLLFRVKNTNEGVLRLPGLCQIVDSNNKIIKEVEIKSIVVFPGKNRLMSVSIKEKLTSGNYTARVVLDNKEEKIYLTGEASFIYESK